MRISSSTIGMESARRYTSESKKTFGVKSRTYSGSLQRREGYLTYRDLLQGKEENTDKNSETKTKAETESEAQTPLQNYFRPASLTRISSRSEAEVLDRIRQQCIQYLMGLFGLKSGNDKDSLLTSTGEVTTTMTEVSVSETYVEEEETSFRTEGEVVTADGRRITFGLEMEMSRRFEAAYKQSYKMLQQNISTCDPLVINLDSDVASVSDQKFLFDIDGDGILENVSQLGSGSGYLAIDKNGDGVINDGTELFGPQSGNGFADLAQYDDDGNGWIDENDAIWEKLLIWTKDENGKDRLYHISEKGVGAIGLQNQSTDFSLQSKQVGRTNAFIRNTGIFLYENGGAGTVQHVDLVKQ